MELKTQSIQDVTKSFYPYIVALFCSIVLLGNIYALKITTFFSLLTPSGMICFPFTFSMCDIITEVYGEDAANRTIRMGLVILILYYFTLLIVTGLEPAPGWNNQPAWELIFSSSPMIVLATFAAYYLGEKVNSKILSFLKYAFNSRFFLRRSIASTFIGVVVDTIVFNFIAFFWLFSFNYWILFTVHQLVLKLGLEMLGSWLSSLVVPALKKYENLDPVKPRAWIDKYWINR